MRDYERGRMSTLGIHWKRLITTSRDSKGEVVILKCIVG